MKHGPTGRVAAVLIRLAPAMWLAAAVQLAHAHPGLHHDIERVTEALRGASDPVDLLIERARLYRLDDQPAASLVDLRRARSLDPTHRRIALELGLSLSALRRDTEADAELTARIDADGGGATAFAERGRVRARMGRVEEAIDDFSAALRQRDEVDVYLSRGRLQESIGRLTGAATGYRDGLERMHGAVVLRLALIRVETARGRFDAAVNLIDEILPTLPVKTEWLLRRATVLEAAGRTVQALAERRRALAEADRVLARRTTAIHIVARAKVYSAMGRDAEAVRELNAALAKAPGFTEARDLLRTIQRKQSGAGTPQP